MKIKSKIIIFDLDGVLINSLGNMKYTWTKVMRKFELNIPFKNYEKYIGLPFLEILKELNIKKNRIKIKNYYKKISSENLQKIKTYKNVNKTLKKLKKKAKLAIFTSKDKYRTLKILKKLDTSFDIIVTPDDVRFGKPNPEGINKILKKTKMNKKNCIYVGDSYQDFIAAKKAKVFFLFAHWGYGKIKNRIRKIEQISDVANFL